MLGFLCVLFCNLNIKFREKGKSNDNNTIKKGLDNMIRKILEYFNKLWYSIFRIGKGSGVINMMNKKITIFDVANFFLKIVDRDLGSAITPLKMQKILYYAQGYYLARYNKPLFNEDFQAWAHGPANPKIYDKYKQYGSSSIDEIVDELYEFDDTITKFLFDIWNTFGIYDGKYLEQLTHTEEPWIKARKGYEPGERCEVVISKDSMKKFFKTEPYNV